MDGQLNFLILNQLVSGKQKRKRTLGTVLKNMIQNTIVWINQTSCLPLMVLLRLTCIGLTSALH